MILTQRRRARQNFFSFVGSSRRKFRRKPVFTFFQRIRIAADGSIMRRDAIKQNETTQKLTEAQFAEIEIEFKLKFSKPLSRERSRNSTGLITKWAEADVSNRWIKPCRTIWQYKPVIRFVLSAGQVDGNITLLLELLYWTSQKYTPIYSNGRKLLTNI